MEFSLPNRRGVRSDPLVDGNLTLASVRTTVRTHRTKELDKLGVMAAGEGMKFKASYDGEAKEIEEYKEDGSDRRDEGESRDRHPRPRDDDSRIAAAAVEMGPKQRGGDGAGAVANPRSGAPPPGKGTDLVATIAHRTVVVGGRRSAVTSTTAGVRTAPHGANEVAAVSERGDGLEGTTTASTSARRLLLRRRRRESRRETP